MPTRQILPSPAPGRAAWRRAVRRWLGCDLGRRRDCSIRTPPKCPSWSTTAGTVPMTDLVANVRLAGRVPTESKVIAEVPNGAVAVDGDHEPDRAGAESASLQPASRPMTAGPDDDRRGALVDRLVNRPFRPGRSTELRWEDEESRVLTRRHRALTVRRNGAHHARRSSQLWPLRGGLRHAHHHDRTRAWGRPRSDMMLSAEPGRTTLAAATVRLHREDARAV